MPDWVCIVISDSFTYFEVHVKARFQCVDPSVMDATRLHSQPLLITLTYTSLLPNNFCSPFSILFHLRYSFSKLFPGCVRFSLQPGRSHVLQAAFRIITVILRSCLVQILISSTVGQGVPSQQQWSQHHDHEEYSSHVVSELETNEDYSYTHQSRIYAVQWYNGPLSYHPPLNPGVLFHPTARKWIGLSHPYWSAEVQTSASHVDM